MGDVMMEIIRRMIFISLQHPVHIDRVTLVSRFLGLKFDFIFSRKALLKI